MEYKECDNGKDLYHFTNIDSLMRIVLTNQFLFNSIKNMNDINESTSFFENEYNKENFDGYIEEYVKNNMKELFDLELEMKIHLDNKDINLAKKEIINDWLKKRNFSVPIRIEEMIDSFMGNIKLCCFNEIGNETIIEKHLLWGHYAKSNTGVAIRFNKFKLISIFKSKINERQLICYGNINYEKKDFIRKINKIVSNLIIDFNSNKNKLANLNYYIDNYEKIYRYPFNDDYVDEREKCISEWKDEIKSIKALNKKLILEILQNKYLIKSEAWSYEDEYRFIIYDHNSKDRFTFLDGINEAIEEIIIGVKANDIDIKLVEALNENIFNNKLKISKYSDLLNEEICNNKYMYN